MKKLLLLTLIIAVGPALAARAADAKAIYEKECAKCHGATGNGDTKMGKKVGARDLTDPKVQAELKDDKMAKSIKEGVKEKDSDKTLMKAFDTLTGEEIKALVTLVRTFKK
jgi:mono/diheme cytochrome c family protein